MKCSRDLTQNDGSMKTYITPTMFQSVPFPHPPLLSPSSICRQQLWSSKSWDVIELILWAANARSRRWHVFSVCHSQSVGSASADGGQETLTGGLSLTLKACHSLWSLQTAQRSAPSHCITPSGQHLHQHTAGNLVPGSFSGAPPHILNPFQRLYIGDMSKMYHT